MEKDNFIRKWERQTLFWGWMKIITVVLILVFIGVVIFQ